MRPLSQYFIVGGALTNIHNSTGSSEKVCVPRDGRIVGCVMNVHTVIDAETTFSISINTVDSGVDFVLPNGTADESGVSMLMRDAGGLGVSSVSVKAGDSIELVSNQQQFAATNVDYTWILERDSVSSISEFYVRPQQLSALHTPGTNTARVAIPWASKLLGCVLIPHTVIGAPDNTFDIQKNSADQNMDFVLPGSTADETGVRMPLVEDGGGGSTVYLAAGDMLRLQTNGEQVAATTADLTYLLERTGEAAVGEKELRDYVLDGLTLGLHAVGGLSGRMVIPEAGRVVAVALNSAVAVDADIDLDIRVNTVTRSNVFKVPNGAWGVNEGGLFTALNEQMVYAGDQLEIRSQGGGAVNTAVVAAVIRR